MANAYLSSAVITNEMLRVLHNKSALVKRINTQFDGMFGKSYGATGKVGQTINVRRPPQFTVRSGPVANIQDITETSVPLTMQPEFGVDFAVADFDLTLNIDQFSKRYLQPAANKLATELDRRIVTAMVAAVSNSVGTPGTPPASQQAAQQLFLQAGVLLTNAAADLQDRIMVLGPSANASTVSYLNAGFNSQEKIAAQYTSGMMQTNTLGWDFSVSQNMPVQTVGPLGGSPVVNGANQGIINGGSTDNPYAATTSLVTNGWTAAAALRLNAGDVFTIAGVFSVNQETKASTGLLQQFIVTAAASSDGAGNLTAIISPAIIAGGAFQNVTARPANSAVITVLGTASTGYPVSLGFVKDAFTLVTTDMDIPAGVDQADKAEQDGISIRYVRAFDITNNRRICRFDILAGFAALRPEWGVRVYAG